MFFAGMPITEGTTVLPQSGKERTIMEIRNNSSTGGASERIDLTRANRDALSKTLATDVKPKKQGLPDELRTDATRVRVKNYREGMHERISNARDRFEARDAFRARVKNAREGLAARNAATDSVELSGPAQELADTAITARPSSVDSSTRAQRISELKTQHEAGKLDVQGLVAEAAYRMLGGE
jgi:hypothetical protein